MDGTSGNIYINGELKHRSEKIYKGPHRTSTDPIGVFFSKDGQHYAYIFSRAGQDVLVIDGKEIPGNTPEETFHLSTLGTHYWFTTKDALVVDGVRYPNVKRDTTVVFNADETEWAAVVNQPKHEFELLRNGKTCASGWYFSNLAFLPDGRLCWTQVQDHMDEQRRRRELFLDGKSYITLSDRETIEYIKGTADGKHLAIGVTAGKPGELPTSYLILDGKKSETCDGNLSGLELHEDGTCFASVTLQTNTRNETRLFINGKASGPYRAVPHMPSVSPSGKYYAYLAFNAEGAYQLITDHQPPQLLRANLFAASIGWDRDERPVPIFSLNSGKTVVVGDRIFGPFAPRHGGMDAHHGGRPRHLPRWRAAGRQCRAGVVSGR